MVSYVVRNLKRKKKYTALCVSGIILSVMLSVTVTLLFNKYTMITQEFFEPFQDYDQVVQRGSNYFQIVPVNSFLDESMDQSIQETLGETPIPVLFVPNDTQVTSYEFKMLMGIPHNQTPQVWNTVPLHGEWPIHPRDVLVGDCFPIALNASFELRGRTYTVRGKLQMPPTFLRGIVLFNLQELQALFHYENRVTLFFVDKEVENTPYRITQLEQIQPTLDVITQSEIAQVRGELWDFARDLQGIIFVLVNLSALIFVFSLATINIMSRRKEFNILTTLGASETRIFILLWSEVCVLILIGVALGIPLSLLTYILITTIMSLQLNHHGGEITKILYSHGVTTIHQLGQGFFVEILGIIVGGGFALATIPALVGIRASRRAVQDLKNKV